MTIIQYYTPANNYDKEEKDTSYNYVLQDFISNVPKHVIVVMGDLNAMLGIDNQGMMAIMGTHGTGSLNVEHVLELGQLSHLIFRRNTLAS